MRILVTGSRTWTDVDLIRTALLSTWQDFGKPIDITVVHGGAKGADSLADFVVAHEFGWGVEIHRPLWEKFGRSAGIIRNQAMVDAGADVCLAFIHNGSGGATHCADAAKKAGIEVRRYEIRD